MKKVFFILLILHISLINTQAQDPVTTIEQQLENLTDVDQAETEDDSYHQQWERFRKNPLNMNTADENDLRELKILSGLQIANFQIEDSDCGLQIANFRLKIPIPHLDSY